MSILAATTTPLLLNSRHSGTTTTHNLARARRSIAISYQATLTTGCLIPCYPRGLSIAFYRFQWQYHLVHWHITTYYSQPSILGMLPLRLLLLLLVPLATLARPIVRHIRSTNEFDRLLKKHAEVTGLPVIVDFCKFLPDSLSICLSCHTPQ